MIPWATSSGLPPHLFWPMLMAVSKTSWRDWEKDLLFNYKQSKKKKKITRLTSRTLPSFTISGSSTTVDKKKHQKKQGRVEWVLPIPRNIDDEHQKHNMKLKPAHQVSCNRLQGLSQACSYNYLWTTCRRKSLRPPSTWGDWGCSAGGPWWRSSLPSRVSIHILRWEGRKFF